jgi:hypothetical protein
LPPKISTPRPAFMKPFEDSAHTERPQRLAQKQGSACRRRGSRSWLATTSPLSANGQDLNAPVTEARAPYLPAVGLCSNSRWAPTGHVELYRRIAAVKSCLRLWRQRGGGGTREPQPRATRGVRPLWAGSRPGSRRVQQADSGPEKTRRGAVQSRPAPASAPAPSPSVACAAHRTAARSSAGSLRRTSPEVSGPARKLTERSAASRRCLRNRAGIISRYINEGLLTGGGDGGTPQNVGISSVADVQSSRTATVPYILRVLDKPSAGCAPAPCPATSEIANFTTERPPHAVPLRKNWIHGIVLDT